MSLNISLHSNVQFGHVPLNKTHKRKLPRPFTENGHCCHFWPSLGPISIFGVVVLLSLSKMDLIMSEVATEREAIVVFGITWVFRGILTPPPPSFPLKKVPNLFSHTDVLAFCLYVFKIGSSTCHQLDEEIQSVMIRIEKQIFQGRPAYACSVCGKEDTISNIRTHIKANHI